MGKFSSFDLILKARVVSKDTIQIEVQDPGIGFVNIIRWNFRTDKVTEVDQDSKFVPDVTTTVSKEADTIDESKLVEEDVDHD